MDTLQNVNSITHWDSTWDSMLAQMVQVRYSQVSS
jgi:hypothetical protein